MLSIDECRGDRYVESDEVGQETKRELIILPKSIFTLFSTPTSPFLNPPPYSPLTCWLCTTSICFYFSLSWPVCSFRRSQILKQEPRLTQMMLHCILQQHLGWRILRAYLQSNALWLHLAWRPLPACMYVILGYRAVMWLSTWGLHF